MNEPTVTPDTNAAPQTEISVALDDPRGKTREQVLGAIAADYKRRADSIIAQAATRKRGLLDAVTIKMGPLVAKRDEAVLKARQVLRNQLSRLQNEMEKEMRAARDRIIGEYNKKRDQANEAYDAVRAAEHKVVNDRLGEAMQKMEGEAAAIEGQLKVALAQVTEWRDQERERFLSREQDRQSQLAYQEALQAHAAAEAG